jgi:outer membrane biosynthesis protein TonB
MFAVSKWKILDRDIFDAHPGTPQQTFTVNLPDSPANPEAIPLMGDLRMGSLDGLFDRGSYKPSELFQESQAAPPQPGIVLAESSPVRPSVYTLPAYPPLARVARVSGQVKFVVAVQTGGRASTPAFSEGNPLLRKAVESSVATWTFPAKAAGQDVHLAIDFDLNCVESTDR